MMRDVIFDGNMRRQADRQTLARSSCLSGCKRLCKCIKDYCKYNLYGTTAKNEKEYILYKTQYGCHKDRN